METGSRSTTHSYVRYDTTGMVPYGYGMVPYHAVEHLTVNYSQVLLCEIEEPHDTPGVGSDNVALLTCIQPLRYNQ